MSTKGLFFPPANSGCYYRIMCCTLDVLSLPRPTFPEPRSIFRSFAKCTQITYAAVILHVNQARCIASLQLRNAKTLVLTGLVRS